jgi:tetratricopeptide (TPR) repeat protein
MLELGYRLTTEALSHPEVQTPAVDRCGALYAASQLAYFRGRFSNTAIHAEQSLAIAREIGDEKRALDALLMLGYARDELGDRDSACVHFEDAVALARRIRDRARLSYALNALAGHHVPGNEDAALPLYEEATALAREVGDIDAAAVTLQNVGRALLALGQGEGARRCLLESLEAAVKIGAARTLLYVLDACVVLADQRHEWEQSARFLAAANDQLERLGIHRTVGDNAFIGPAAEHARAAMGHAAFADAMGAVRSLTHEEVLVAAKSWLATMATAMGRSDTRVGPSTSR